MEGAARKDRINLEEEVNKLPKLIRQAIDSMETLTLILSISGDHQKDSTARELLSQNLEAGSVDNIRESMAVLNDVIAVSILTICDRVG
jgi:hypothetical protein